MKKNSLILSIIFLAFLLMIDFVIAQSAYGEPILDENYEISRSKIEREISQKNIFVDSFIIKNLQDSEMSGSVTPDPELSNIISLDTAGYIISGKNESEISVTITGKEPGIYIGYLSLSGDVSEKIYVNITVLNSSLNQEFIATISSLNKIFTLKERLEFKLDLKKILSEKSTNVTFTYILMNEQTNKSYDLLTETLNLTGSFQTKKVFDIPLDAQEGFYKIDLIASYKDKTTVSSDSFQIKKPFMQIKVFGIIPVWLLIVIMSVLIVGSISFSIIKKEVEKRRKYKMKLYTKTLPKKEERSVLLGKVAEKNIPAYLEIDKLTTHAVVAGATGGGKSIAAQVIIEEILKKNIAVIVFDPTAQWSGMLRKCDDKKMLSFYKNFNMKETEARAFPGNVRQIVNARQIIDINKHMTPGQIQIFTLNKLDPSEMDVFVSSVIASIFRSGPKEHPGLKVMLVFDEVHRLLPKFGGTGKGFLQIERACREFRKWGLGVMLVSQVLSDFVGEIKANINTEVQMRTRDESDLNRIKTKYGEEFLQSLIKASVGVGMFVNPAYNRGKPYFINFRPILHNTRRLSDDVLDKYNQYSETIEEIEYQIEQLEQEKVDTFDLKMELKLIKDKLMTGNFTVVDIYLESLQPRVAKQWDTLGKKPKKKQLELIGESEVNASIAQAQKERAKIEEKEKIVVKEEKKEDKETKIVKPITFDNGVMVASLKELKDVLPPMDEEVFKIHVNDNKNQIADWVAKEIDPELGAKIKDIKDKKELIKALSEKPAKEEDKK